MFIQITMNIYWINLLLFSIFDFTKANEILQCSDGHTICPPDKPICTDVGCVFECPDPFYNNESICVSSCGDMFIVGRTCNQSCPINWYIREKPKVIGLKIVMERICIESCNIDEYILNVSCVHLCPVEHNFIDGNKCLNNCPDDKPYKLNFSSNSIDFHRCFQTCPDLSFGFYCTNQCSSEMFEFNSTCVPACPLSYPFKSGKLCSESCTDPYIYHENNTCYKNCFEDTPFFYPVNQTCNKTCPDNFYLSKRQGILSCESKCRENELVYNRSCVSSCPSVGDIVLYKYKETCVGKCPVGTYLLNHSESFDSRVCLEKCPEHTYKYNSSCLTSCPNNTFLTNSSCVDECPVDLPYICAANIDRWCGYVVCNTDPIQKHCVQECPRYRDQNTCVQICPVSKIIYKDICVTKCPSEQPFAQAVQYDIVNCKEWEMVPLISIDRENRNTCVSKCQDGLVIFNLTCQQSCPADYHFLVNGTCHEEKCTKLMYETSDFNICIDECQDNEFILNGSCVKQCPKGFFRTNNTCHIERCQTKYSYKLNDITVCIDTCSSFRFILNSTCTDFCPYFAVNNMCENSCPESQNITMHQTLLDGRINFIECLEKCPSNFVLFNNTCVTQCPDSMMLFNGTCLNSCPASSILKVKAYNFVSCVDKCSDPYPLLYNLNLTCVDMCPQTAQYVHLNVCKESCDEKYQYRSKQGIVCSKNCPNGKLQYNFSCYDSCPKDLYNFSGVKCVQKCPSELPFGFKVNQEIVLPGLVCFVVFLLLLFYTRTVIKEYLLVFGMVLFRLDQRLNLEKNKEENTTAKQEDQDEQLILLEDDDTIELMEF